MARYNKGLGSTTNNLAESYVVWIGICYLKDNGYTKVIVEGGSKLIIDYLNNKANVPWELKDILDDYKNMLQYFQSCKISHTYREGNRATNAMENFGFMQEVLKYWDFTNLSNQIKEIISQDRLGDLIHHGQNDNN